jgi:hypothetical protein
LAVFQVDFVETGEQGGWVVVEERPGFCERVKICGRKGEALWKWGCSGGWSVGEGRSWSLGAEKWRWGREGKCWRKNWRLREERLQGCETCSGEGGKDSSVEEKGGPWLCGRLEEGRSSEGEERESVG